MAKRDNNPSEFERVAHAGWMVTLRYQLLLQTVHPPRRLARWPWVIGGVVTAATTVTSVMAKVGWL